MIHLLYGADTYRSRKKLHELTDEYRRTHGMDAASYSINADEEDLGVLRAAVETSSLFSTRKIIQVEQAFSGVWNSAAYCAILERAHKDDALALLLWHGDVNALAKKQLEEIKKLAHKVQEFSPLTGNALAGWIGEEAKKRGIKLFPAHSAFLSSLGSDLWAIANTLDQWVVSGGEAGAHALFEGYTIFQLGDAFFTSSRGALTALLHLTRQGQDAFGLFMYLANHTRKLLAMKTFLDRGQPVSASLGIHPFVVKKATQMLQSVPRERLECAVSQFFEEDWKIKTGLSSPEDALVRMVFSRVA